uniref:Fibronectin type-III domain-containing protein n=1 Tax=Gadus morhua TaxID=8049 RepID=A0A8C5CDF9_GADMO
SKSFPPSCSKKMGNNMTITWIPLTYNYTFELRSGGVFSRVIDLRQIIKPKSPSVTSAVFQPESNQAMIYIKTPYDKDFLKTSNQLFQYYIWSAAGSELVMSEHLTEGTMYQVKVRAIPFDLYGGSWSDWSNTVEFYINSSKKTLYLDSHQLGFAMNLEPEQFSQMNVQPMKKTEERPGESQAATADDTSGFTGESASTALSESSEEETYSRPNNRSPSPSMGMHAAEGRRDASESSGDGQRDASPEVNGPTQPCRDAVYVTMSSFYYHNDQ